MATSREITVELDDRPGALGKLCQALFAWRVNIAGFQVVRCDSKSLVRIVTDDLQMTRRALEAERLTYTEGEIVVVRTPHRPGELAPIATQLGDANININYAYCGIEPGTNVPLLIFGVADADRATATLEQAAGVGH